MTGSRFKPRVLVADDEEAIRSAMIRTVEGLGHSVEAVEDGNIACQMIARGLFDIVFLDIVLPGMSGVKVLKYIRENHPDILAITMTGFPSIETAVECMKLGAMDYIVKPFRVAEVEDYLSKATQILLQRSNSAAPEHGGDDRKRNSTLEKIIGKGLVIAELKANIKRVAATGSTILITGESGTGKELVARAIHDLSKRADNDFVPVDCSTLVESLLESELFGHVKGAFTGAEENKTGLFELANDGTFFFDEISNLSIRTQTKLLRVIQEREFMRVGSQKRCKLNIRILCASNRDLLKAVERGTFRHDLYYRINVVPLHIPPLRERSDDIPLLLEHFLEKYNAGFNRQIQGFSDEAIELLMSYPYPGNVRELEHIVEQIYVLEDCDIIEARHLPSVVSQRRSVFNPFTNGDLPLEEIEKKYIQYILRRTKGIRHQAADILQINRKTLAAKIKKYGLNHAGG